MSVDVVLPWPPSVNAMWRNVKGRTLLSLRGRSFRKSALDACLVGGVMHRQLAGRLSLRMVVCAPDRRERDLDNIVKGVQDALTHAGVWRDDSQIDRLLVERGPTVRGGEVRVSVEVIDAA